MKSSILDGKATAEKIKTHIRESIEKRVQDGYLAPTLATILVGSDPASQTYVNMKNKACESVGMKSRRIELPENTTTDQLLDKIQELNEDNSIQGILLQHPSPPQVDERSAFDSILPTKDVDGVTTFCYGKLAMDQDAYFPCTPYGMILLLREYGIEVSGKKAVVVGRSPILGKPMAAMLTNLDATVTLCHSKTKNLDEIVKTADIVVGAVGRAEFIKGSWIKEGAVVLDAGYNAGNVGDIELSVASEKSSYHTPVPGGVGPMTIAVLLLQTLYSWEGKFSPALKSGK
ncbi:tetrahydrofolate dehydrogenase/cyclohydrolase catalytic domain-containing protein [Leptospira sp. GIMC2001]|uniref:tetrahydrofolate dehydrogenase/cyclohydrolase catalytic domain-containing protein n=1 Tax=Leptospira sp. GIMC2001 TaxID=1513297 RepID=UPI00234B347C|nr:tetrahydrofolate dehydrogenase/cyclohydrolase catalytic domain-containing protein [Leptospira sp. GIMC2001]WCL48016.1 bifunctional methylenetetrahydrofolate dehydrogenase/methenyltetrahydrofolate cyclohydrolase [Leptospira sp. GIMC2001]